MSSVWLLVYFAFWILLYFAPGAQGIGDFSRLILAFFATVLCMAVRSEVVN
jgi:hypothetical protein